MCSNVIGQQQSCRFHHEFKYARQPIMQLNHELNGSNHKLKYKMILKFVFNDWLNNFNDTMSHVKYFNVVNNNDSINH